jgi:hypothetical protein
LQNYQQRKEQERYGIAGIEGTYKCKDSEPRLPPTGIEKVRAYLLIESQVFISAKE